MSCMLLSYSVEVLWRWKACFLLEPHGSIKQGASHVSFEHKATRCGCSEGAARCQALENSEAVIRLLSESMLQLLENDAATANSAKESSRLKSSAICLSLTMSRSQNEVLLLPTSFCNSWICSRRQARLHCSWAVAMPPGHAVPSAHAWQVSSIAPTCLPRANSASCLVRTLSWSVFNPACVM